MSETKQKLITKIPLVIALITGVLAVVLARSYFKNMETQLYKGMELVKVVSSGQNLEPGTILNKSMLTINEVPSKFVQDRAVYLKDANFIVGQQLTGSLKKGDIILWSDLGEYSKKQKLSDIITKGERALTFPVDTVSSLSGMIRPNDHVDIIGTFTIPQTKTTDKGEQMEMETITITLLQNVIVLATGTQLADTPSAAASRKSSSYNTVTLLVTQEEAQELIFAQTKGMLTLVLRNEEDIETSKKFPKTRFKSILKEEFRQKIQTKRDKRVEIIRGGKN